MPSTNYAILTGEGSMNSCAQQRHTANLISQICSTLTNDVVTESSSSLLDPALKSDPVTFIAGTDSSRYVVDSGANRFIVNDARLLRNLRFTREQIKGINGNPTAITGTGLLNLTLCSDRGTKIHLKDISAVYVPQCPYNLLPPHLLHSSMKARGFIVDWFKHDDREYVFEWKKTASSPLERLTCKLGNHKHFDCKG